MPKTSVVHIYMDRLDGWLMLWLAHDDAHFTETKVGESYLGKSLSIIPKPELFGHFFGEIPLLFTTI